MTATLTYGLVVIDSTGEAMAAGGVNSNDDAEVAVWFTLAKRLGRLPGKPCVLVIDHVPKPKKGDDPARYAIGSQRKRSAVTGAAYVVETLVQPAKGKSGKLKLTVAKDRPGNRAKDSIAAIIEIQSTDDGLAIEAHLSDTEKAAQSGEQWRPTWYMEQVCRYLEIHPGESGSQIRKGVKGSDQRIDEALMWLVTDGWVQAERRTGPGGGQAYRVVHAYTEGATLPVESDVVELDEAEPFG